MNMVKTDLRLNLVNDVRFVFPVRQLKLNLGVSMMSLPTRSIVG